MLKLFRRPDQLFFHWLFERTGAKYFGDGQLVFFRGSAAGCQVVYEMDGFLPGFAGDEFAVGDESRLFKKMVQERMGKDDSCVEQEDAFFW